MSYQWYESGERKRTTWPDGYFVHYETDDLGRMTRVRENSTSANEIALYTLDPLSLRQSLKLGASTTNLVGYTYETDLDLDVLTHTLSTNSAQLDYGHNLSGQITSIAANDDFYLAKPISASTIGYVSNKLNQYGSVGGVSATYDNNGNLLTWSIPGAGSSHTYTYTPENMLRTATVTGTGATSATYEYDGLGRRVSKVAGGVTTQYLSDGDEEIAEYNSSGTNK
ncbi:MAG: hypothetical protein R3E77_10310 [Steroidobacteraceae bacterium]